MHCEYVSGLIDGEGSISITCRTRYNVPILEPVLRISNTNKEALEKIASFLGGFVTVTAYANGKHRNKRTCYNLVVSKHQRIRTILEKCLPHLIIKKKQAILMLQFLSIRDNKLHGGTPKGIPLISADEFEIYKQLCEVNRRYNSKASKPKFETWKDVQLIIDRFDEKRRQYLDRIAEVKKLRSEGKKVKEIAQKLNLNTSSVEYYLLYSKAGK